MNIGILGGAFNPPHLGHLWIARQVLDFTDTDKVWLLPNYGHRYFGKSAHKTVAPVEHRLAMTRFLEADHMVTSEIEIQHQTTGQTIELLPLLPHEHTFSFIIGSDQLPRFREWHGYKELLAAMRFLVFPRFGFPTEPTEPGMHVVSSKLLIESSISSTVIRDRIAHGLSIQEYVPDAVSRYIQENGLYREGIGPDKEASNKFQ